MLLRFFLHQGIAALVLGATLQAITFTDLLNDPTVPTPVAYKSGGTPEQQLWVFPAVGAKAGEARPTIVLIHGGAWVAGGADVFFAHARYFASRGMVAVSINYRLLKADGPLLGDCLSDCKSSIRYLRVHAKELGIDPDKIVVLGDSAGGHLAGALGTVPGFDDAADDAKISAVPNAMILCNPILDMMEGQWGKFVIAGKALDKKAPPEALIPTEAQTKLGQQLSPQNNVRAGLPPTLLMHGLDDHVVNPDQARKFAAAMTDAKNRCDLVLLEGARHAFILAKYTAPEELVVDVIHKVETFLTSLGYLSGDSTLTVSATPAWEPAGKKKK